jgi:hypothetical protein
MLIGAIVIALVTGFWFFPLRNPEPAYNGRRLGEWVTLHSNAYRSRNSSLGVSKEEAATAIRAIGTNGLPFLTEWTGYEPGKLRSKLNGAVFSGPSWLRGNQFVVDTLTSREGLAVYASEAFAALGSEAAPAIPELVSIAQRPGDGPSRQQAVMALGRIGPAAIPALTNLVANTPMATENRMKHVLMLMLQYQGTNLPPGYAALLNSTESTDPALRAIAAEALGNQKDEASGSLPAAQGPLVDSDLKVNATNAQGVIETSQPPD